MYSEKVKLFYLNDVPTIIEKVRGDKGFNTIKHLVTIYKSNIGFIGLTRHERVEAIFIETGSDEVPSNDALRSTMKNLPFEMEHIFGEPDIIKSLA